jgi:uncharacterized RDD family membrane protein YckC
MTIDSTWLCAFKEELPHAFTQKNPFRATAVFVDGQIKLMQGSPGEPLTWDDFIYRQFVRHLAKFFDACDVVILAFDNYEFVPRAKCMTQAKRRKNIPVLPFSTTSELPCMVPEGERWTQSIANRVFKTRVIDLVLLRLPMLLLRNRPDRRLIVDYQQPVEFRFDTGNNLIRAEVIEELPAMGEADVKFTRFADRFGKLMVDSIDGDSIPIALMHHEMCLRKAVPPPVMSIYRMQLNTGGATTAAGKRQAADDDDKPKKRAPKQYEYVNVHALYEGLRDAIAQSAGRIRLPTHTGHKMAMLVGLIALTGTDFSRNLPQMSGRSVFSWLPDIWPTLATAYNPGTACFVQERAVHQLVALLYRTKFPKHARSKADSLQDVLSDLQHSSIAARTKESLPTLERVACTVRNANWVLAYWTCVPAAPDPIQPQYGFRLLASGCPEYDD